MQQSSNGWLRLAALLSAIVSLLGAIKTIGDFFADLGGGDLRWSLS